MTDPVAANPLHGNPLLSRADVERALLDLVAPLARHTSPGGARVRIDGAAAHFDRAAADLEGFARPLWGLAPHAAGGGSFAGWPRIAEGLANGTDPAHPEYWGKAGDRDQRLVELAALGFALRLAPQHLWEPQTDTAKDKIARYLLDGRRHVHANNNWKFFRVMVDLALDHLGIEYDRALTEIFLDELDAFYIADGWYRDGDVRRVDHYIGFAMHFYGLIYARLAPADPRSAVYRERAKTFAPDFRALFDADGGTVAFGRSMTYRFACAGFWAALAFAEEEALPWPELKGLYLRHLRWWADKPIASGDGVLTVGFGYPQLFMSESYNSAGSPYWALKAFLPLILPPEHPFWTAPEAPLPPAGPRAMPHPGFVAIPGERTVTLLSCGQANLNMRAGPEKYAKFAYSSRYGFSVEVDERGFATGAFDNALALSEDHVHFRVRETNEAALIAGTALRAVWKPWPDVTVETTLVPAGPWHVRIHRVETGRPLALAEGGFAIRRNDGDGDPVEGVVGRALAANGTDVSVIVDLGSSAARQGRAQKALPNTNLIVAKTTVPQLRGRAFADTPNLLVAAVYAGPGAPPAPPPMPDLVALDRLFAAEGRVVSAMLVP